MTRWPSGSAERATDREVGAVAAFLVAGSEEAAAQRRGLSHSTVKHHLANARSKVGAETTAQLVWILASRLPESGIRPLRSPVGSVDCRCDDRAKEATPWNGSRESTRTPTGSPVPG
jgi:hypothetical protein